VSHLYWHRGLADIEPISVKENFDLIPGNLELYRMDMASGQGREFRVQRFLEEINAKDKYDFIIIDTPPTPSPWMFSALIASDYYIVPVKPEPLSRTGVDLLKGVIERISKNYGKDIKCIGVVLTIAEPHHKVFQETVEYFDNNELWKGKRFNNILLKRTKISSAQGKQKLILEVGDVDSKKNLAGIVNEMLKKIE
jgi:chromosome partitioning protein